MKYPGTPEARDAATILMGLPSPLDRFKADHVPKDLVVGVLGKPAPEPTKCVAISSDCGLVASGGTDKLIHVWDTTTGGGALCSARRPQRRHHAPGVCARW
jgi:hypothetical protein